MDRDELGRIERHAYADGDVRLAHLLAGAMNLVDLVDDECEQRREEADSDVDRAMAALDDARTALRTFVNANFERLGDMAGPLLAIAEDMGNV